MEQSAGIPSAVIFDCEYLAVEGSTRRFWSGHQDPDPVLIQIGAVRIGLGGDFAIVAQFEELVLPLDRRGRRYPLAPYITDLTGITEARLAEHGVPLSLALERFALFAQGGQIWSWGKDEFLALALSCYVQGLAPPIPATRFGNLKRLLADSGLPMQDLAGVPSGGLAGFFGVAPGGLQAHDGLDDALSLAAALRHLLQAGRLRPSDLTATG